MTEKALHYTEVRWDECKSWNVLTYFPPRLLNRIEVERDAQSQAAKSGTIRHYPPFLRRRCSMVKRIAATIGLLVVGVVHAGDFQYDCTVSATRAVDNAELPSSRWGPGLPGQRFTINRETGAIGGSAAFRVGEGQDWRTVEVLDRGSSQQSFKLLAVSSGRLPTVIYVEVKEEAPGAAKPFMHYENWKLTLGTCR